MGFKEEMGSSYTFYGLLITIRFKGKKNTHNNVIITGVTCKEIGKKDF